MSDIDEADTADHEGSEAPGSLADVAGLDRIKRQLEEAVLTPVREDHLRTFGASGILIHGPAGVGKSYLAQALMGELGFDRITVAPADVPLADPDAASSFVRDLRERALDGNPSVVYVDQFDVVAPADAGEPATAGSRQVVAELCRMLDALDEAEAEVFLIGVVRNLGDVHERVRRLGRIDITLGVPKPEEQRRFRIVQSEVDDARARGVEFSESLRPDIVADATAGFTAAQLVAVVRRAVRSPEDDDGVIYTDDLLDAVDQLDDGPDGDADDPAGDSSGSSGDDDDIDFGQFVPRAGADDEEADNDSAEDDDSDRDEDSTDDDENGDVDASGEGLGELFGDTDSGDESDGTDDDEEQGDETQGDEEPEEADDASSTDGDGESADADEAGDDIQREEPEVGYEDVGGLPEVKQRLREVTVWPRKYPDRFEDLDIDTARGIVLYGPPGTGKTLLARAVANETDSTFISISGPEVLDKYVGESEKYVRRLFEEARESAPSVVFIDELDAVTGSRDEYTAGAPWMDTLVNQFLSELDGLDDRGEVVVIGATNRLEVLDPAITRPGRLGEAIEVPAPDAAGRREIFRIHTADRTLADDVDLEWLVAHTDERYTGADIEELCERAAMNAMRDSVQRTPEPDPDRPEDHDWPISHEHFVEALENHEPTLGSGDGDDESRAFR